MGAAAFILAQFIGRPYAEVALAAAIPAVLYYLSLYAIIDLEARRLGIATIPRSELPDVRRGLRERAHLLLPLLLLVYFIVTTGGNLATAALWASAAVLGVSFIRRATRMGPARIVEALASGAQEAITVAAPTAVAGLIIGVVIYTGLALKFTSALQALAVGQVWLALVLVMLACLILGMGMPTSAAYLMAAVLLGPALQRLGLLPLAAHLFIFYFAVISMVTPPVALAAYAAAGLAKTSMWQTGWTAFRLAVAGFLIPYAFVFDPALILVGPLSETAWRTATTAVGVVALAAAVVGYLMRPLNLVERALVLAAAVLMIVPEKITDFVGLALFALIIGFQWTSARTGERAKAAPEAGAIIGPTKMKA
jgi:TRAP transporter 4TM/12TM fusion protein